jgi:hypothetical protein
VISDSVVVCPWCGRRRQQPRKPFRLWKLFFGDVYAGLSLFFLMTIIGATCVVFLDNNYSTMSFYIVVILVIALPAALVIRRRIRRYQRIFREGIYLSAKVTENTILTDAWAESHYDASISNRLGYLVAVIRPFLILLDPEKSSISLDPGQFESNLLRYSYNYKGQEYHQMLPYTPGQSTPKVVRDAFFKLLRSKPPTNVTLWMLRLKSGDTIDVVLNPDDPKQSYIVNLYT